MTASLRRCGGLFDAVRALVHLLCQLSRTIVPTVTDYRANCHGLSCQLSQIFRKNRTPLQLAFRSRRLTFYVSFLDDTGSEQPGLGYNIYIRCGSFPLASPWSRSSRSEEHGRLRMVSRGEKRFSPRPASCLPCPVGGFCRPAAVLLCQSH